MKALKNRLYFVVIFPVILFCLTGCVSSGGRFYSGDLLSEKEVAIFVLHRDLDLKSLYIAGKQGNAALSDLKIGELSPGFLILCVGYNYHAAHYTVKSRGCAERKIDAQAGHVYYILPVTDYQGGEGSFTWMADVIDIASDADYEKFKDGNKVKNQVNSYLKGQRPEIKM